MKLNEIKNVNIDSSESSNVYFKNDDLILETSEKHYFFDFLRIFAANSKTEYDFQIFRLQISILTNDIYLIVSFFAKKQKISFLIFFRFLLCFFRPYIIHLFISKISSLIISIKKKQKKQIIIQTILFFIFSIV